MFNLSLNQLIALLCAILAEERVKNPGIQEADWEDLSQDLLARFVRRFCAGQLGHVNNTNGYIARSVKNSIVSQFRNAPRHACVALELCDVAAPEDDPTTRLDIESLLEKARAARINEEYLQALESFLEGNGDNDVATQRMETKTGKSWTKAKFLTYKYRGIEQLGRLCAAP